MSDAKPSKTSASFLVNLGMNPHDPVLWETFVKKYGAPILTWALQYLEQQDAEDVTQELLLGMPVQLGSFEYDPSGSFRTYLQRAVKYTCFNVMKARQRRLSNVGTGDDLVLHVLENRSEQLSDALAPEIDHEIYAMACAQVQLEVSPRDWDIHRLTMDGVSAQEIADRFKITKSAVYMVRMRIKNLLAEKVQKLSRDEDEDAA